MNQNSDNASTLDNSGEFLTFIIGKEEYGVDILSVQGIQGWNGVTRIPDTPDYMLGVINLRGAIVPIIDLRVKFRMATAEFHSTTVVIVVRAELDGKEHVVGVVVDAVSEVYKFDNGELQTNPEFNDIQNKDAVKGLISIEEKMVIILDIDLLIADWLPDLSAMNEAA
jgi:purine-binding chemotaxis protein CheW